MEWEDFEVKAAKGGLPKNTRETVSAFSNTSGGWLLFGIAQTGSHFEVQGIFRTTSERVQKEFGKSSEKLKSSF
ncbi:MAG: ATP-binding protein [Mangrovibacterium sp.]